MAEVFDSSFGTDFDQKLIEGTARMTNSRENPVVLTHRKFVMARRVNQISSGIASFLPDGVTSVLDVGAGTGEMALALGELRPELKISGVDVYVRPKTFVPVTAYDGVTLPFEDKTFDAVMVIDVLHHCTDPVAMLRECARVSRCWVVLKDHIASGFLDKWTLRFMDWVGNKAHGVTLPFNYLSDLEWQSAFDDAKLQKSEFVERLELYPFPFDYLFERGLHCLHLLKKY